MPSSFSALRLLPIGYRDSLFHVCSPPSTHPYSWFAVRYVHGFCHQASFRRPIAGAGPCRVLAFPFRPITAGCRDSSLSSLFRSMYHAQRTSDTPGKAGGLKTLNRSKRLEPLCRLKAASPKHVLLVENDYTPGIGSIPSGYSSPPLILIETVPGNAFRRHRPANIHSMTMLTDHTSRT
jgi:hypothetical protein